MTTVNPQRSEAVTDTPESVPVAEQLLRDILDTVREPLLVLDHDLRVMQANRAFFSTFRLDAADSIGREIFTLGDGQWDVAPIRSMLRERLVDERHVSDVEVDHVFQGVGRTIMLLNARLVSGNPGGHHVILVAIEDVTERRIIERRLAAQRQELLRSNDALHEFASVASHDLQEPLRKILSFGERLNTSLGASLTGNDKQYLDRMLNAATRMRALISNLLAYSQITTRGQRFARTDLAVVAKEVAAEFETAIAESGAQLEIDILPTVEADAVQMRQLLENLIGNALKYRRKDVALVVRVTSAAVDGGYSSITVTDNGIGFSEVHAEKIFRMFERLHGRAQYEGSGIGLAICRKIVERHGGTIAATGTNGQGASFTVTLPVTQSATGQMS